jgi:hypothetical protein
VNGCITPTQADGSSPVGTTAGRWWHGPSGPRPTLAAGALVALEVSTRCQADSVDCSWGLEVLLILPVLFVSLVTVGPWAVCASLRRAGDPLAGSTARWALLLIVPAIPLVGLTGGGALLLLPPLGARALARHRHQADVARRPEVVV